VKENATLGSPFYGTFSSDRTPKATKDVNVHFFMHSSNSCKFCQRVPVKYPSELRERFEANLYVYILS